MALSTRATTEVKPLVKYKGKNRKLRHQIPDSEEQPCIDYDFLKNMCNSYNTPPGSKMDPVEEEIKHKQFMENYHKMFIQKNSLAATLPSITTSKQSVKSSKDLRSSKMSLVTHATGGYSSGVAEDGSPEAKVNPVDNMSHDIRDYVAELHRERIMQDPENIFIENIKSLRKLSRKLPFERTATDNEKMFKILETFPDLANQVSDDVLRELCVIAQLDLWKEVDFTVFGSTGLYVILKGSVAVRNLPYLRTDENEKDFRPKTPPPPKDKIILKVGDSFGTLQTLEGRSETTKILTVITEEPNCEFLRISCSEYKRVIKQLINKDQTEKMNLLSSCEAYKLWPPQPLSKVANLIEWQTFPANTVLVSEGYRAPFIGAIKSGECHVLRQVEKKHTLPNGKQEVRKKQVVMGKLCQHESFGEISLLGDEPITCTIITSTVVKLAVIEPDKLRELDEITLQLIKQSSTRTFGDFSKNEIYEEYMNQELKREWNEFKHNVVIDVINSRGVRPGYGKWSK